MITFKFLYANQITSYFVDQVDESIAQKRSAALQDRTTVHLTVEEDNGKFYLMSGFKFYDAIITLNENRPLPCFLCKSNNKSESKRIVKVLKQGFNHEATSWRFKYYLIQKLTNQFKVDCLTIANYLSRPIEEVSKYMVEDSVPNYYKKRAIQSNTSDLINTIYSDPAIPNDHKQDFYELAIAGELTHAQLYLTASYYNMSYYGLYAHPFA